MPVAVLVNARSGAGDADPVRLAAQFAEAGVEAQVQPLGRDLAGAVCEAATGAEAVVVGGGDGTIRAAAEALAGGPVPLGVLPMGTFNHFARGLGIPTDRRAAIRVIAEGACRSVSAGRINGRLFLNNAALGLAPEVVVYRHESHGSRLVRALLTAPVALRALLRLDRLRLAADLDGRPAEWETPFVFVTPNDYAPSLFRFAVRGRQSDGRLFVHHVTPDGPADAVRIAFHVLRGRLDRHLHSALAGRLTLSAERPSVRVLMDGDVHRMRSPLEIVGVPDAVRVLVPSVATSPP